MRVECLGQQGPPTSRGPCCCPVLALEQLLLSSVAHGTGTQALEHPTCQLCQLLNDLSYRRRCTFIDCHCLLL